MPTVFVASRGTTETITWRASAGLPFQCQRSLDLVTWSGFPPTTAGTDGIARCPVTPQQTAYYRPYFPDLGSYGQTVIGVVTQQPGWTGYLVGQGPFTFVTGTFRIPSIQPSATRTDVATWVGIGGWAAGDPLIQAGAWETYDQESGQTPDVYAWWELVPPLPVQRLALPVHVGDTVTVTIQELPSGRWSIDIANDTLGGVHVSQVVSYPGTGSSAEWVVEAALGPTGAQLPLAQFSPVTFTRVGSEGTQPSVVTLWTTDPTTGAKRTTVSALSSDRRSFTVIDLDARP